MSGLVLNPGQREAVDSRQRRIVVNAGAGSGKTKVLAERFADAVLEGETLEDPHPVRSILLITFTDKAAGELTERVRRVLLERGRPDLAREVDGAWISTIHGFCARLVRRHALELGVDPSFGVLADPQVGVVQRESFETAAAEMLSDPGLARLMEIHGPEVLRSTVLASYDRVRSIGAAVEDVTSEDPPDLGVALRESAATLRDTLAAYKGLSPTATLEANTVAFAGALAKMEMLGSRSLDGRAAFDTAGLRAYRGALRGSEDVKELTRAANEALDRAAGCGVDALAALHTASWRGLLMVYGRVYEDAKATLGVLDFEDLQLLTRRLWREDPSAGQRYSRQFRQVMVDEFQDTNELQFEAIEPVAAQALCLVGDVQQSIYRFRDADVSLFIGQRASAEALPDGRACELTVNYRSHPDLLSTLNALFVREGFFGSGYLHLTDAGGRSSRIRWPEDEPRAELILVDKADWESIGWREAEARALARRLRDLVDDGRMVADDIVVLVRATTTMHPYIDALRALGFDVYAGDAGGFHATPEVADARALLRVLANPLDGEGVLRLLAGGLGGLSDDALSLLAASNQDADLWAALPAAAELGMAARDVERARLVRETIDLLREKQGRMRLADAILYAVSALGPGGGCLGRKGARGNLRKVARLAAEFEKITPADPAAFLRYLADRETYVRKEASVGSAVEGVGAIRVMTIHGAKGLEFPVVVVADLGHGAMNQHDAFMITKSGGSLVASGRVGKAGAPDGAPDATAWRRAVDEEAHLDLEESKRVFYVACTRAEQVLILSGSAPLAKEPGTSTDIDRLRAAIADAGPAGVPGLAVTVVTSADEEALLEQGGSTTPDPLDRQPGEPAPLAILRAPEPIAPLAETSYTALLLYERCGYRFFAERMLGVGSVDIVDGADPRAFGSALHAALQTVADGRGIDDERIQALARAHRLPAGAGTRLRGAIEAFAASEAGALSGPGRAEVPFAVRVGGGLVVGSMDLVAREGDEAQVVDYKTGSSPDADLARYTAQAEIYALALLVDGCRSVIVRFVRVEAGCVETVLRFTGSDRSRIGARVEASFARMTRREFPRRSSFDAQVCPECPVSGSLCPVTHPGVRARSGS